MTLLLDEQFIFGMEKPNLNIYLLPEKDGTAISKPNINFDQEEEHECKFLFYFYTSYLFLI